MTVRLPSKRSMAMEIWKDIEGFDGYQISSEGRVRSHGKVTSNSLYAERHWKDRIIKQKVSRRDGRARVCLWGNGREHTILVHRLLAEAFLGKPEDDKMTVNHKDGNPLNNVVENIEWISRKDNIRYGFEHGQYSTQKPITITADGEAISFRSYAECDRFLNRKNGYVSATIKRKKPLVDYEGNIYQYN